MKTRTLWTAAISMVAAISVAHAPISALAEKVSFPGAKGEGFPSVDEVTGDLFFPEGATGKVPAVLLVHGSGGIDGRGEFHAEALRKAGIATLEIFMFNRGGRPKAGHTTTLTHAFGALKYLASRPEIDPKAIGVMGFSWGGNVSLRSASKEVSDAFMGPDGQLRFAAHAPFYPVCWSHQKMSVDPNNKTYKAFTGAPLLLFAGGEDDYGGPDDCKDLIAGFPEETRKYMAVQFYPTATHGWDTPSGKGRTINDPVSHRGQGGSVRFTPDSAVSEDSREKVVAFFVKSLKKQ